MPHDFLPYHQYMVSAYVPPMNQTHQVRLVYNKDPKYLVIQRHPAGTQLGPHFDAGPGHIIEYRDIPLFHSKWMQDNSMVSLPLITHLGHINFPVPTRAELVGIKGAQIQILYPFGPLAVIDLNARTITEAQQWLGPDQAEYSRIVEPLTNQLLMYPHKVSEYQTIRKNIPEPAAEIVLGGDTKVLCSINRHCGECRYRSSYLICNRNSGLSYKELEEHYVEYTE